MNSFFYSIKSNSYVSFVLTGKLPWYPPNIFIQEKKRKCDEDWPRHYSALLEYCKEYGHCNVPNKHSYSCELTQDQDAGGIYHYRGNLGMLVR